MRAHDCAVQGFLTEPQFTLEWGQSLTLQESVRPQEHACLCLVFAVGSSGAGSGLQAQPLVVEGILVLVLGCFHYGKRRQSNYAPQSVLKSLLLKALLPCAAECSWFHGEQRRVN